MDKDRHALTWLALENAVGFYAAAMDHYRLRGDDDRAGLYEGVAMHLHDALELLESLPPHASGLRKIGDVFGPGA